MGQQTKGVEWGQGDSGSGETEEHFQAVLGVQPEVPTLVRVFKTASPEIGPTPGDDSITHDKNMGLACVSTFPAFRGLN